MTEEIVDTKKAEALFTELKDCLVWLNKKNLQIQAQNASDAVRYLGSASSEKEKEEIIRSYYRYLFPAKGGLADIVIWDDDAVKRKAINRTVNRIKKELETICKG